jgi:hypothetical protein
MYSGSCARHQECARHLELIMSRRFGGFQAFLLRFLEQLTKLRGILPQQAQSFGARGSKSSNDKV